MFLMFLRFLKEHPETMWRHRRIPRLIGLAMPHWAAACSLKPQMGFPGEPRDVLFEYVLDALNHHHHYHYHHKPQPQLPVLQEWLRPWQRQHGQFVSEYSVDCRCICVCVDKLGTKWTKHGQATLGSLGHWSHWLQARNGHGFEILMLAIQRLREELSASQITSPPWMHDWSTFTCSFCVLLRMKHDMVQRIVQSTIHTNTCKYYHSLTEARMQSQKHKPSPEEEAERTSRTGTQLRWLWA